jgi:hypothetical protein
MKELVKFMGKLMLSLTVALAFGYGFYGITTYVYPLSHDNYRQAMTSPVADDTEVLLNGAEQAYEQGRTGEAARVLELELEKLVDKSGRSEVKNKWKLERVYFLLGKCYQRQEQFGKARENYIETLRLNPNHLPAKYNLEMIEPQGGKGGPGKQPSPGKIQPKI